MSKREFDETAETEPRERKDMHLIKLTVIPPFTLTRAC